MPQQSNPTVAAATPSSLSNSPRSGAVEAPPTPRQYPSSESELKKWEEERTLHFWGTTNLAEVEYRNK